MDNTDSGTTDDQSLFDYTPPNRKILILFFRTDCEFCSEAMSLCDEVTLVKIVHYQVFQSRIEGKVEIRPFGQRLEGLPLLVDEHEIPEVPCLLDPVLGQMVLGVAGIEKYLEDVGLV